MPQPAPIGHLSSPAEVRPLAAAHLPGLMAVQEACYGAGFLESTEVFGQRLASPANCSLVAVEGDAVLAYLAAYRSVRGKVTALHGGFETPSVPPDTLYLHDMAVHPDCAGRGLAGALLEALWREGRAAGLRYSTLVSVQGSRAYWGRRGYAVREPASPEARERLAGYGAEAVYMERVL